MQFTGFDCIRWFSTCDSTECIATSADALIKHWADNVPISPVNFAQIRGIWLDNSISVETSVDTLWRVINFANWIGATTTLSVIKPIDIEISIACYAFSSEWLTCSTIIFASFTDVFTIVVLARRTGSSGFNTCLVFVIPAYCTSTRAVRLYHQVRWTFSTYSFWSWALVTVCWTTFTTSSIKVFISTCADNTVRLQIREPIAPARTTIVWIRDVTSTTGSHVGATGAVSSALDTSFQKVTIKSATWTSQAQSLRPVFCCSRASAGAII